MITRVYNYCTSKVYLVIIRTKEFVENCQSIAMAYAYYASQWLPVFELTIAVSECVNK